jgi:hypothetical protein
MIHIIDLTIKHVIPAEAKREAGIQGGQNKKEVYLWN